MMQRHSIILVSASLATIAVGRFHEGAVKRTKDSRNYGRHGSGRYHMPGQMMTKAGKRAQMQKDFSTCNRRKGRPR